MTPSDALFWVLPFVELNEAHLQYGLEYWLPRPMAEKSRLIFLPIIFLPNSGFQANPKGEYWQKYEGQKHRF